MSDLTLGREQGRAISTQTLAIYNHNYHPYPLPPHSATVLTEHRLDKTDKPFQNSILTFGDYLFCKEINISTKFQFQNSILKVTN